MAYIRDPELIYNKMQTNGLPFYRVLDSDGKSLLDENDDENVSVDEAVNRLRDSLENTAGLVTVLLSAKNRAQKGAGGKIAGDFKFTVKLGDTKGAGINGFTEANRDSMRQTLVDSFNEKLKLIEEKHAAEIKQLKKDHETEKRLEKLEADLKEAKSGGIADQYLPIIAGLLTGQQPNAVAGIPETENTASPHITGTDEDNKVRMTTALNKLFKADKNFLIHLEMLAKLAESKPLIYKLAIEKLKSEIK
jgi:hypothetical protein